LLFLSIPCLVAGQELSLARVTAKNVNVRLGPGTAFPVIGGLAEDTAVVVCGKQGEWYRVYLPKDFHLYVNGKDLSLSDKEGTCLRETAARLAPDRGHFAAGMLARDSKVKVVRAVRHLWAVEPPLSLTDS